MLNRQYLTKISKDQVEMLSTPRVLKIQQLIVGCLLNIYNRMAHAFVNT